MSTLQKARKGAADSSVDTMTTMYRNLVDQVEQKLDKERKFIGIKKKWRENSKTKKKIEEQKSQRKEKAVYADEFEQIVDIMLEQFDRLKMGTLYNIQN